MKRVQCEFKIIKVLMNINIKHRIRNFKKKYKKVIVTWILLIWE